MVGTAAAVERAGRAALARAERQVTAIAFWGSASVQLVPDVEATAGRVARVVEAEMQREVAMALRSSLSARAPRFQSWTGQKSWSRKVNREPLVALAISGRGAVKGAAAQSHSNAIEAEARAVPGPARQRTWDLAPQMAKAWKALFSPPIAITLTCSRLLVI